MSWYNRFFAVWRYIVVEMRMAPAMALFIALWFLCCSIHDKLPNTKPRHVAGVGSRKFAGRVRVTRSVVLMIV